MSIQLIITGDHVTDVLAEIRLLNAAVSGPTGSNVEINVDPPRPKNEIIKQAKDVKLPDNTELAQSVDPEQEVQPGETVEIVPKVAPKTIKMSLKEQVKAVEKMIAAGEVHQETYDLLTKKNKKIIDNSIKQPIETSVEDMFSEPEDTDIDLNSIRDLMGALTKDEYGEPIQDMLLKIRELLVGVIPQGIEVMVSNIPEDQIESFYATLKTLEG